MKKLLLILFLLLGFSQLFYSQNKSVLICGFSAELGMDENEFMGKISDHYILKNVNSPEPNHQIFVINEDQKNLGMVEFDERNKLISVHKNWGEFSSFEGTELFENIFSILEKYKTELNNCEIFTNNIIEPDYKIKTIIIRSTNRDFTIAFQNNNFSIEEHLY